MGRHLTAGEYRAYSADSRAMARCFLAFEALPECALKDMRSLSIHGSSLARQIIDEGTASASAIDQARMMVALYEDGTS
jgi:hypothetical protein